MIFAIRNAAVKNTTKSLAWPLMVQNTITRANAKAENPSNTYRRIAMLDLYYF
jgi:hypothetical protein